jgi:hypothetical protein
MTPLLPILDEVRRTACLLVVLAVIVAAAFGLPACRAGHDGPDEDSLAGSTTSTTAVPEIKVTVALAAVESMRHEPVQFPDDIRAAVVRAVDAWIGAGVVAPLLTGQPPVGLDASFTPGALARLTPGSPDRASLVEDTRPAEGGLAPEKATVSLVGLADGAGSVALVTAALDVSLVFVSPEGRLRIARTGEVTLVPVADGWRIDSYDVVTKRDTLPPPQATTTTGGQEQ